MKKMNFSYGIKIFILISIVFLFNFNTLVFATSNTKILRINLLNQNPDPAVAGDILEIKLSVENYGGKQINGLIVELNPIYPFIELTGQNLTKDIGSVGAYQSEENSKIISFKLLIDKNAPATIHEIPVSYYEIDSSGKQITSKVSFNLEVEIQNREFIDITKVSLDSVIPGESNELSFTIKNVGTSPLKNLEFSWKNENGIILPIGSDNSEFIQSLDVGESRIISFNIIADTSSKAGVYLLDLNLKYDDPITGEIKSTSTQTGIYVGGNTDFEISISQLNSNDATFAIANVGINPSYSVNLRIPPQEGWLIGTSNSEIIGNLDSGDYTLASFELTKTGNKDYILLDILYTNTNGKRLILQKEVYLSSLSEIQSNNPSKNDSTLISNVPSGSRRNPSMAVVGNTDGIKTLINGAIITLIVVVFLIAGIVIFRHKKVNKKLKKN